MDGITTGMAFLTGLGLPEILLWVLTFAIVFGVLVKLKIFSRAPSALISIVVGFLVLLAVPVALITVIAGMSTSLLVVAIAFLVIMALVEVTGTRTPVLGKDEKTGKTVIAGMAHPFQSHGTVMAIILIIIAAIIFWGSGGAALIGFTTLPAISMGTWLLVVVGAAVLWMLSEAE